MTRGATELGSAGQLTNSLGAQLCLLEEGLGALHLERGALRCAHLGCLVELRSGNDLLLDELILEELLLLLGVEEEGLLAGCAAVVGVVAGPLSVFLIHWTLL